MKWAVALIEQRPIPRQALEHIRGGTEIPAIAMCPYHRRDPFVEGFLRSPLRLHIARNRSPGKGGRTNPGARAPRFGQAGPRLPAKSGAYQTRARPARSRAHPSMFAWSLRVDSVDCLVIGAGVIGLAVARTLACAGREVIVVEAEEAIGTGTSSRNSEVIHAGIYYPTGLAKTRLCVEGKALLYDFCRAYAVPHQRCGKLIVAARRDRGARARSARGASSRQRRRRPRVADRRRGACARACAEGRARPAFAVDRDRGQPRLDAGAAGRRRGPRSDSRVRDPGPVRPGGMRPT